ncbi:MAG: DUF2071 domain-containing protein [Pyrinomonadaceae bacterium]
MSQPGKFLTAQWKYLAMLNYVVDPAILKKYVPTGTEIDRWNDRVYISLVGFMFLDTRLLGIPIPFHQNFEEVNLRFYVRRKGPEGWRRGVVFVRELVPRWAIATVARVVYNEQYSSLPMRHKLDVEGDTLKLNGSVEYGWRFKDRWNCLGVETEGPATGLTVGSEAEFITEHYWGYAAQRDGGSMEYQVEHPPWQVWNAADAWLDCDAAELYTSEFVGPLGQPPDSAFVALGSPIVVRKGLRI